MFDKDPRFRNDEPNLESPGYILYMDDAATDKIAALFQITFEVQSHRIVHKHSRIKGSEVKLRGVQKGSATLSRKERFVENFGIVYADELLLTRGERSSHEVVSDNELYLAARNYAERSIVQEMLGLTYLYVSEITPVVLKERCKSDLHGEIYTPEGLRLTKASLCSLDRAASESIADQLSVTFLRETERPIEKDTGARGWCVEAKGFRKGDYPAVYAKGGAFEDETLSRKVGEPNTDSSTDERLKETAYDQAKLKIVAKMIGGLFPSIEDWTDIILLEWSVAMEGSRPQTTTDLDLSSPGRWTYLDPSSAESIADMLGISFETKECTQLKKPNGIEGWKVLLSSVLRGDMTLTPEDRFIEQEGLRYADDLFFVRGQSLGVDLVSHVQLLEAAISYTKAKIVTSILGLSRYSLDEWIHLLLE